MRTDFHRGGATPPRRGFTLIELLVVVAIIGVLIALLLPALRKARDVSRLTVCLSSLHQISIATNAYATDSRDMLPDAVTTGRFNFRRSPGQVTPNGPAAIPETYGWAAVLHRGGYMDGKSKAWVCVSQPQWMAECENTYAFSIAANLANTKLGAFNPITELLWDNFTVYPGLTGFIGPFSGYTIPTAQRVFAHDLVRPAHSSGIASLKVGGEASLRSNEP